MGVVFFFKLGLHSLSVPMVSKIEKGNSQSIIVLRWKENRAIIVALINLADSESIKSYAKWLVVMMDALSRRRRTTNNNSLLIGHWKIIAPIRHTYLVVVSNSCNTSSRSAPLSYYLKNHPHLLSIHSSSCSEVACSRDVFQHFTFLWYFLFPRIRIISQMLSTSI